MTTKDEYELVGLVFGVLTFFAIWVYAIFSWGFLLGIAAGWIPAIIGAIIVGGLWPVFLVIAGIGAFIVFV